MAIDLKHYGISGTTEIVHNPSYKALFDAEMDPTLTGYEKGQLTELGAVNVMTGVYTGRSPKDQVHRRGRELQGHRLVDLRRIQERQQARLPGDLGCLQEAGAAGAVQQEAVRHGRVLRHQP